MKKIDKKKIFNKRKLITSDLLFEVVLEDYDLRDGQQKVVEWAKPAFASGKKFLILNAPVGSGKSLMALLLMKHYLAHVNKDAKFDLLTLTKNLQSQYMEEFPFMNNLWGKSNYTCDKHNNTCDYGKVCNNNKGEACEECPHTTAFERWKDGKISLTNFHIHGLYSIFMPAVIKQRSSNMLIVDECHTLEQTVNSFVSFNISKKQWSKFVSNEKSNIWERDVFILKDIVQLVNWMKTEYIVSIDNFLVKNNGSIKGLKDKELEKHIKLNSEISGLKNSIQNFIESYENGKTDWIADKKIVKGTTMWDIQPLWTDKILKEKLWANYSHVVLMSGTILDPNLFCELNGIDINDVSYIKLNMNFPVSNRPIYYMPIGKMSYTNKEKCWQDMKPYIEKILKKYEGKKGIFHCGNFEIQDWMIRDFGKNKRFIFATSENRQESIDKHMNSPDDTILVSPSMAQGIDLKDDLGRFQVILKMPYPSLASKVNKTRFENNPKWYSWATILDLVQSYGRIIRSDMDYGDTIILDECFSDIMRNSSNLLPKYFTDAVKKIDISKKKK
jgi:ATP-dependent DNA helicase DinG